MTPPGGRRRATPVRPRPPKLRLAVHATFILLTVTAWVILVRAAIDFGSLGREGQHLAWVFTALASLGAVGCLMLALVLGTRVLALLGLVREQQPKRAAARRRAK